MTDNEKVKVVVDKKTFTIPSAIKKMTDEIYIPGHGPAKTPDELAFAWFLFLRPKEREKYPSLYKRFKRIIEC